MPHGCSSDTALALQLWRMKGLADNVQALQHLPEPSTTGIVACAPGTWCHMRTAADAMSAVSHDRYQTFDIRVTESPVTHCVFRAAVSLRVASGDTPHVARSAWLLAPNAAASIVLHRQK